MKSSANSWDLGTIQRISEDLKIWRKPGALHQLIVVWKIWLDHVKEDILKFIKGGTIALRNLVSWLKSGAEHEYWLTFLVIVDDFPTFTDGIANSTFGASRSCRIEELTSSIDRRRYKYSSTAHRTWFVNLSQVKATQMSSTYESHMPGDRS